MNLTAFQNLTTKKNCGQCSKKFDKPWVVPSGKPYPNNLEINAEVLFHWEDTHGYPSDILADNIWSALNDTVHKDPVKELLDGVTRGEVNQAVEDGLLGPDATKVMVRGLAYRCPRCTYAARTEDKLNDHIEKEHGIDLS